MKDLLKMMALYPFQVVIACMIFICMLIPIVGYGFMLAILNTKQPVKKRRKK